MVFGSHERTGQGYKKREEGRKEAPPSPPVSSHGNGVGNTFVIRRGGVFRDALWRSTHVNTANAAALRSSGGTIYSPCSVGRDTAWLIVLVRMKTCLLTRGAKGWPQKE